MLAISLRPRHARGGGEPRAVTLAQQVHTKPIEPSQTNQADVVPAAAVQLAAIAPLAWAGAQLSGAGASAVTARS